MEENKRQVEKKKKREKKHLSVQIITRQTAPRKTAVELWLPVHSQFTAHCSDCICNPSLGREDLSCLPALGRWDSLSDSCCVT